MPAFWYHNAMTILRRHGWLVGLALLAVALYVFRYEHDLQYRTLHAGDRFVPIRVSSLYGSAYTLRSSGRPLVINVFATWCVPCREETPGLAAAAQRLRAQGIEVIGIDQQESGERVQAFARDFHVRYPLYVDSIGLTHSILGARYVPTTFYVDASGVIAWEHPGPISQDQLLGMAAQWNAAHGS